MPITTDILIPVYNQPQAVHTLMESLVSYTANTEEVVLGRVILGDDQSNQVTADYLDSLPIAYPHLNITILRHPHNLGYAGNCNALFAESKAPFVIVLNSDTVLPPRWLSRMVLPFIHDENIVLTTPLSSNAANHTIKMNQGQSWRDVDVVMEAIEPTYPDACTAIGFCLGVRRDFFEQEPLFDEAFGRGYGEDSDLHFRVVAKGKRSVIVDNLVVHHIGGSSFSALPDLEMIKAKNGALFFERWQQKYAQDIALYQQHNALGGRRHSHSGRISWRKEEEALDVLLVLPAIHQRYGGIRVGKAMMDYLINKGYRVGIYSQTAGWEKEDEAGIGCFPWYQKDRMFRQLKSVKVVFASGHGTVSDAKEIAAHYGAALDYFVQGPETFFVSGLEAVRTAEEYTEFAQFCCVSTYLTHFIRYFTDKPAHNITLGPDAFVFYPTSEQRESNTIAIALNLDPNKGSGFALTFAIMAKKAGFKVCFFGFDAKKYKKLETVGEVLGCLEEKEIAKLFNRVEYFIDFSLFEGLGLLALEAAFCGAIPVVTPKGGADYIFTDGKDALFMGTILGMPEMLEKMQNLPVEVKQNLQQNAIALRKEYDKTAAFARFENYLQTHYQLEKLQDALDPNTMNLLPISLMELETRRNLKVCIDLFKQNPGEVIKRIIGKIRRVMIERKKRLQAA